MTWQLGLSRFIHGSSFWSRMAGMPQGLQGPPSHAETSPDDWPNLTQLRESLLVPAMVATILDFEGKFGQWPPTSVTELLNWAGPELFRPDGSWGGNVASEPFAKRRAILMHGLAAFDSGLRHDTGATFEELSPPLRADALAMFERGALGMPHEAAEKFMDLMVEAVTFAFLNFKLEMGVPPAWSIGGPVRL